MPLDEPCFAMTTRSTFFKMVTRRQAVDFPIQKAGSVTLYMLAQVLLHASECGASCGAIRT